METIVNLAPEEGPINYRENPWRSPEIADRSAFLKVHPECLVTPEVLAVLEPEIRWRASLMVRARDELTLEDVISDIIAGIFECATQYRFTDELGYPVFDYLAQVPSYVVRHAAGHSSSYLRKVRKQAEVTFSYDAPLEGDGIESDDEVCYTPVDPSAEITSGNIEFSQMVGAIAARLESDPVLRRDPSLSQIWSLLATGHDRADIAALLGVRRQRVHDRCAKLRGLMAEYDPSYGVGRDGRTSGNHLA